MRFTIYDLRAALVVGSVAPKIGLGRIILILVLVFFARDVTPTDTNYTN
jgi:hypothetical protein